MRVFVTGTGRCASVTFREACRYATNYTTGHESQCGLLEYPDNHIEVNPHLRHCITLLAGKYPDAKWVHLIRDPVACQASLAALDDGAVMEAYRILYPSIMPTPAANDVAFRYYWSERDVIDAQLKHRVGGDKRWEVHVEKIDIHWPMFWEWIGAKGDYPASLAAWSVKRNTTEERKLKAKG